MYLSEENNKNVSVPGLEIFLSYYFNNNQKNIRIALKTSNLTTLTILVLEMHYGVETFLVLEKFSDQLSAAIRCYAALWLWLFDAAMEV